MRPDESPPSVSGTRQRAVLLALGWIFVAIGAVGVVLPLLPTTPFLLLAAACWARSSERFLNWLLDHRTFGAMLRTWRSHRALPPGLKARAIALVVATFALSMFVALDGWLPRTLLGALGTGLVVFLARLPVHAVERLSLGSPPAGE